MLAKCFEVPLLRPEPFYLSFIPIVDIRAFLKIPLILAAAALDTYLNVLRTFKEHHTENENVKISGVILFFFTSILQTITLND